MKTLFKDKSNIKEQKKQKYICFHMYISIMCIYKSIKRRPQL